MRLAHKAVLAFRIAEIIRHPELPEGRIYRALIRLRDLLEDVSMQKAVHEIQDHYLVGEYDDALASMDRLEKSLLTAGKEKEIRELNRLRGEVHLLRKIARDERVLIEWERLTAALLRSKAFDQKLDFATARDFAESQLLKVVEKMVAERLHIGEGDPSARLVWDRRPARSLRKHSYGHATWLKERPERSDGDAWWKKADKSLRFKLLMGFAIEKHYDVKEIVSKNCPTCGGDGVIDPAEYPNQPANQCPDCLSLAKQRVLIYR